MIPRLQAFAPLLIPAFSLAFLGPLPAAAKDKPQPAPDGRLAPPAPAPGNQAALRLMRKCDCGAPGCDCDMGDDKKKRETDSPRTALHRAALSPWTPREAPPIVHETLRSTGHTLDPETQAFFEARFGQRFSQVRVHSDTRASESARAVNALAYTVGRDIVFAPGRFAPRANEGRRLLAHELAHVVQQRDAASLGRWNWYRTRALTLQAPLSRMVTDKIAPAVWHRSHRRLSLPFTLLERRGPSTIPLRILPRQSATFATVITCLWTDLTSQRMCNRRTRRARQPGISLGTHCRRF